LAAESGAQKENENSETTATVMRSVAVLRAILVGNNEKSGRSAP
jgi:hypothetical protein